MVILNKNNKSHTSALINAIIVPIKNDPIAMTAKEIRHFTTISQPKFLPEYFSSVLY